MTRTRLALWLTPLLPALLLLGSRSFSRDARGAVVSAYRPVVRSTRLDRRPQVTPARGVATPGRPRRWWVIGWDGASWDLLLPLLDQGRLPNFARLMNEGVSASLQTIQPTLSPALWTTIATGLPPSEHGILDFVRRPEGVRTALRRMKDPESRQKLHFYSNADRRVPALWNLVSDRDRPVLVVGYHNTYPAEKVKGAMVSNYLVREHWLQVFGREVEGLGVLAFPSGLAAHVRRFRRARRDLTYQEIRPFADVSADEFAAMQARPDKDSRASSERWLYLTKAYANDEFNARVAEDLLPRVAPDLFMLHFQCIDWASHEFLQFHAADGRRPAQQNRPARQRYDGTVTAFYEYADQWLGRLLALRGYDTAVAVLSDHGFEAGLDDEGRGHHADGAAGILVVHGPGIRRGARLDDASIYDVFPTLAASYGLPLLQRRPGRVLEEAFAPGVLGPRPADVASYAVGSRFVPPVAVSDALDGELQAELRALGYIE